LFLYIFIERSNIKIVGRLGSELSHNSIHVGRNHIVHLILLDFQVILGMEISKKNLDINSTTTPLNSTLHVYVVVHVVHGVGFLSGNQYVKVFCIVSLYLYWEIKY
jgi:hypothetical protein